MSRTARIVVPDAAHHVAHRGRSRQEIFVTDDERLIYVRLLREQCERFDLAMTCYCLMPDHIHLLVTPARSSSLAQAIGITHRLYAQYIHRFRRRSGRLWQNRFYSYPVDRRHEVVVARYVEQNPVRAGMVRRPWQYRWSSAAAHVGERDSTGLLHLSKWRRRYTPETWRRLLCESVEEQLADQIRGRLASGRPLGGERFVAKLEATFDRPLRPRPLGRPRKFRQDET